RRARGTLRDRPLRLVVEAAALPEIVPMTDDAAHVLTVVLPGVAFRVAAARACTGDERSDVRRAVALRERGSGGGEHDEAQDPEHFAHEKSSLDRHSWGFHRWCYQSDRNQRNGARSHVMARASRREVLLQIFN